MLSLISILAFPQSKKELKIQVQELSLKVDALEAKLSAAESKMTSLSERIDYFAKRIEELERTQAELRSGLQAATQFNSAAQQDETNPAPSGGKCAATTASGKRCSRNAESGSNYCWQHKDTYEPDKATPKTTSTKKNSTSATESSSSSSEGRVIYTGPRGGKYYINSNGKKTYIKR